MTSMAPLVPPHERYVGRSDDVPVSDDVALLALEQPLTQVLGVRVFAFVHSVVEYAGRQPICQSICQYALPVPRTLHALVSRGRLLPPDGRFQTCIPETSKLRRPVPR